MPYKNRDLHGLVPERSRVSLLLIDVINPMDFPGSEKLVRHAQAAAKKIAALKERARKARVPSIYVNDNFGRWRSDFRATVKNAQALESPGNAISLLLAPDDDDYFVLKPKHSGFYGTSLDLLLGYLETDTVILAGFAGDMCVQSTAHDAFLRDHRIVVASDAVASEDPRSNTRALEWMRDRLGADIKSSARIDFGALRRRRKER